MQFAIQVLYQGYTPVTNVLIVEKLVAGYSSPIKKQPLTGCLFYFRNIDRLKKSCPGLPPCITGGAGTPIGCRSEETITHFCI